MPSFNDLFSSFASDALTPGEDADTLGSGAATAGQALIADGVGGTSWGNLTAAESTFTVFSNLAAASSESVLNFRLLDSLANETVYAQVKGIISSSTDGAEEGELTLGVVTGGVLTDIFSVAGAGVSVTGALAATTGTFSGILKGTAAAGGSGSAIQAEGTVASFAWHSTFALTDQGWWDVFATPSGTLRFRLVDDANSTSADWLTVQRLGITVNAIAFGGPIDAGSNAITGGAISGTTGTFSGDLTFGTSGNGTLSTYGGSNNPGFSHSSHATATSYALLQTDTGATIVNAAAGQGITHRINGVIVSNTTAAAVALSVPLNAGSNAITGGAITGTSLTSGTTLPVVVRGDRATNTRIGLEVSGVSCFVEHIANGSARGLSGFDSSGSYQLYSAGAALRLDVSATQANFQALNITTAGAITGGAITGTTGTFSGTLKGTAAVGGAGSAIQVESPVASFAWHETDASADEGWWDALASQGSTLRFRLVNDADTVGTSWLTVTRSGMTVSSISFGGPINAGAFISSAANPATAGVIRLSNNDVIRWRNAANTANSALYLDTSDTFRFLNNNGSTIGLLDQNGIFVTRRNDATVGVSGAHYFQLNNASASEKNYASILGTIRTNTAGAEDGSLDLQAIVGGTIQTHLRLQNERAWFRDGTAALPAISFVSDTDTGIYRVAANNVGMAVGGSLVQAWGSSAITIFQNLVIPDGGQIIRSGGHQALLASGLSTTINAASGGAVNLTIASAGIFGVNATRAFVGTGYSLRVIGGSSDPGTPSAGDVFYRTDTNKLRVYNGTSWVDLH